MTAVCVFCGTRLGRRPEYAQAAAALGAALARRGLGLVYGGAETGSMGAVAQAALAASGAVTGVLIQAHHRGPVFGGRVHLEVVASPHARMRRMAALAGGFIALPGGLGTLEELFEMLTWAQAGLHAKPIGLLNTCGYYDQLGAFLDFAAGEDYLTPADRRLLLWHDQPEALLDALTARLE